MSDSAIDPKKSGWLSGMIDGASRVLAFGGASSARPKAPASASGKSRRTGSEEPAKFGKALRKIDMKGVTLQVQRLAADGHERAEIARQTALSQDTVAFLLHLTPAAAAENAGQGK